MEGTPLPPERQASCPCGALIVITRGEPRQVYACRCVDCQRRSGSAFTYAAIYPADDVTVAGPCKVWRRRAESGRFIENHFCETCGVTVFFRGDGFPGMVGVSAGCFADQTFPPPARLYWTLRRQHWLVVCADLAELPTQPDVAPPPKTA